MNRTLSNLGPALILAVAVLMASALVQAAPHAGWAAVAGPLLVVLALVGADLVRLRRSNSRLLPSAGVLIVAAAIAIASGLIFVGDPDRLAAMIPILGSCALIPVLLRREGARESCR